jgi:hypothetical protein
MENRRFSWSCLEIGCPGYLASIDHVKYLSFSGLYMASSHRWSNWDSAWPLRHCQLRKLESCKSTHACICERRSYNPYLGGEEAQSEAKGCWQQQQQRDPRKRQQSCQRFRSPVQWEQQQMIANALNPMDGWLASVNPPFASLQEEECHIVEKAAAV